MAETLLAWSGGWDSTLMLVRALQAKCQVSTYSLEFNQLAEDQIARQRRAREELTKRLVDKYGTWHHRDIQISGQNYLRGPGLVQPLIWISQGYMLLPGHTSSELCLGYIRTDSATSHLRELRSYFQAHKRVDPKPARLYLPLIGLDKAEVVEEIYDEKLAGLVTTCENNTRRGRRCICLPCKRLDEARLVYKYRKSCAEKRKRKGRLSKGRFISGS